MQRILTAIILLWSWGAAPVAAEKQKKKKNDAPKSAAPAAKAPARAEPCALPDASAPVPALDVESSKLPTFINSQTLTLLTEERRFVYSGGVDVTQGDLKIVSKELEGTYDENNKIQGLVAKTGVIITKGDKLRATSERATYNTNENTVVLTEGPRLEQEGSILTADLIRVFLKDNRSVAEGNVKVTLVNKGGEIDKATQGITR